MGINLGRRAFLRTKNQNDAVRLPWLKPNLVFTDKCTRCGDCKTACPEHIIRIGDGGFPEIDFSIAECSFCKECVSHCQEDLFDLTKEKAWDIKANISNSCLNAESVYCRSCAESCEVEALKFNFTTTTFVIPEVVLEDCTGCGACVSVCPTRAISVK